MFGVLSALACGGCQPAFRVMVVPLGVTRLTAAEPLLQEFKADRCVYWSDDAQRLCVAGGQGLGLAEKGSEAPLVMSLVLDEEPAGSGRSYRLGTRHLRMTVADGPNHARWASVSGIASVWTESDGRLRGRFRLIAKQQQFFIALGWGSDSRVLLSGEFIAAHNPEFGRAVLALSETDGMGRPPSPTVAAHTSQAAAPGDQASDSPAAR